MDEDASLDDFLGAADQEADEGEPEATDGDGEAAETGTGDAEPVEESDEGGTAEGEEAAADDAGDSADDATAAQTPDPAVATYDWTPGGADCAACGETVERRWRDDPGFVCEACKDW